MSDKQTDSCAVIVPVYASKITDDEQYAIRHLKRFLGDRDIYVVSPEGLRIPELPYTYQDFSQSFFSSRDSYSRLLLSREFYAAFAEYEFMLIYQLDALVFDSDLARWTGSGYDYIGAPLFVDRTNPQRGISRVGNGGLSLRRIRAFLDVIDSSRDLSNRPDFMKEMLRATLPDIRGLDPVSRLKKKARVLRDVRAGSEAYRMSYSLNEDLFWSDRAKLFSPDFTIAPVQTGLAFAFEQYPAYCFEQNGGTLPYGCHAWEKWDRAFWEPYLLHED